jgi:hypothetical protein
LRIKTGVTSVLPSAQAASGAIRAICVAAFQESKLLDLVNGMLVDAFEYMAQMTFRLDVIELGGAKQ